jgi:hypothetical protein
MPPPEQWWAGGQSNGRHGECRGVLTCFAGEVPALSVLDPRADRGLYCARDAGHIPQHVIGSPFLHLLAGWMARRGKALIHAGAVGTPDGGALLIGKGGSGKSTTVLACLGSELRHAAEDYVLLADDPEPSVHSLYQSAKLHGDQLWRLPHLAPLVSNPDRPAGDKALMFLSHGYPNRLIAGFPLRVILLPRVTGRHDTRVVPAAAGQCLNALLPNTLAQLPALGVGPVRLMSHVVARLPNYVLELGTDLAQIPETILGLLRRGA